MTDGFVVHGLLGVGGSGDNHVSNLREGVGVAVERGGDARLAFEGLAAGELAGLSGVGAQVAGGQLLVAVALKFLRKLFSTVVHGWGSLELGVSGKFGSGWPPSLPVAGMSMKRVAPPGRCPSGSGSCG